MSDDLTLFLSGQRAFGDRVHAVSEEQWSAPTPATQWSVADLVSHLVTEHRWAAPLLHGQDLDTAGKIVQGSRSLPVDGGVGANLAEEWDEACVESADAFSADGALERTVALSAGPTPARDYLQEMLFDLVVHSWDLAAAIGYAQPLPDELVDAAYATARAMTTMPSSMFDAPVEVSADAPTVDKLVALTGRDPGAGR